MATAYSETFVNFVGIPDTGANADEVERFKIMKMYERRTHHDTDKRRVPTVILTDTLDLSLARCRGSCIAESINRFGDADVQEVTTAVREVHARINN